MMMGSKTAVYAVLAVALGYVLISAVPDQIVAVRERSQPVQAVPEEAKGLASGELDTFAGEKPPPLPSGFNLWDGASLLGLWLVNLLVALGVYFLVKRRLS